MNCIYKIENEPTIDPFLTIKVTTSAVELEVKLIRAEELWSEFNTSQNDCYQFANEECYVDPGPDFEEVEAKFLMLKFILLSAIRERLNVERNNDIVGLLADQQQVIIETLKQSNTSRNSDCFLPSIRIELFSGN